MLSWTVTLGYQCACRLPGRFPFQKCRASKSADRFAARQSQSRPAFHFGIFHCDVLTSAHPLTLTAAISWPQAARSCTNLSSKSFRCVSYANPPGYPRRPDPVFGVRWLTTAFAADAERSTEDLDEKPRAGKAGAALPHSKAAGPGGPPLYTHRVRWEAGRSKARPLHWRWREASG